MGFPGRGLALREVAAYLVSEALGWNIVPRTWLRDGPLGEGMVQLWQETDPEQTAVDLVPAEDVPETGWKQVLEGEDQNWRTVALITRTPRRCGGWRCSTSSGSPSTASTSCARCCGAGSAEALSSEELDGVARVLEGLGGELGRNLAKLLTAEEIEAFASRCARLRSTARFPEPSGDMPAVPWPLF